MTRSQMLTCENCKLILELDTVYCPRCGRRLAPDAGKPRRVPDSEIQALLLEARTFKARSAWDAAVEKCIDALKKDPESPETYTVLGEIYEAQGRFDQAVQWYQMAEIEYASAGKPVQDLQARIRCLDSCRTGGHQTTGWFDRFVGGSRFSASMRVITVAMVGFLILLILGAVFVIYADKMRDRRMSAPRKYPASAPPTSLSGGTSSKDGDVSSSRQPQPAPSVAAQPNTTAEATPEQKLVSALAADSTIAGRRIIIKETVIDPRHRQIIVQFKVSPAAGGPTRSSIMADCAAICAAAYAANPEAAYVTLCALADSPEGRRYGLVRVFVADTNRQTAANASPLMAPVELERLFANQWWNSQIAM